MNFYLSCHKSFINLNCKISFESCMILMGVRNQKTTIHNIVRAIKQIFVLDPVN